MFPIYVRYCNFAAGQLLWKPCFLLLEGVVIIIKVIHFLTSYPLSNPLYSHLGDPTNPLREVGSSCPMAAFCDIWHGITLFFLKGCPYWLSWLFIFSGFFAISSWLNPKCWCSLIPLYLLLGSLMSLHLQDWLLPVGWSLACLYLQPRLFSWAVSQTLYTAVAMDGYGENTVGCLFSCVSCAWWCHHHPSSQLNIPFSSSLLNTSNLVLQEPHNISVSAFNLFLLHTCILSHCH